MAKSTIILADNDERFLAPLELKFLEELDENVDLEIITNTDYFKEYFSAPKSANVLVVSEELYSSILQKHNINSIFVLTEQVEDGETEDLAATKIFKYTSPKDIYKQVISMSPLDTGSDKEKETVVALVYSASGGVGKSTVALGVSTALAKAFNRVLYINAQRINSFQHNLTNTATIPNSVIAEFGTTAGNLFGRISHIIRNETFDYLPPFGMALASLELDFSIYAEIIKSAKASKKYDVIVVDTDTTFDESKAELITLADRVFIVVNQTNNSVFATNTLLKNISCNDNEKYHFICNNFDDKESNALIAANVKPNFIVNEYVRHFEGFESMTVGDIAQQPDMQKVAYLIV